MHDAPAPPPDSGEVIDVLERVIVSPAGGIYEAAAGEELITSGDVIGHVAVAGEERIPVRSPFSGRLVEIVAWHGERVLHRQRIAWIRVAA